MDHGMREVSHSAGQCHSSHLRHTTWHAFRTLLGAIWWCYGKVLSVFTSLRYSWINKKLGCRIETVRRMSVQLLLNCIKDHFDKACSKRMTLKVAQGHRKLHNSIGHTLLPSSNDVFILQHRFSRTWITDLSVYYVWIGTDIVQHQSSNMEFYFQQLHDWDFVKRHGGTKEIVLGPPSKSNTYHPSEKLLGRPVNLNAYFFVEVTCRGHYTSKANRKIYFLKQLRRSKLSKEELLGSSILLH